MVIGSCGCAGGEPHLQEVAEVVLEIAREDGHRFKLALIHAEQDKNWVKQQVRAGQVRAWGPWALGALIKGPIGPNRAQ